MNTTHKLFGVMCLAALMTSGCSTSGELASTEADMSTTDEATMHEQLSAYKSSLEAERRARLQLEQQLASSAGGSGDMGLLPPAKPGECYAKTFIPPKYKTETAKVLKREAGEKFDVVPATYEMVDEQILVKEASQRLEPVPASYKWVEEKIAVRPESFRVEETQAVYKTVSEKVIDKPAHTVWKTGRGPIEKIDNATGEIMCLVDVPATYKTISKRVLVSPAATHQVKIPAAYKTIKKRVIDKEATVRKIEIPAEYRTVRVRKMVSEPQIKSSPIPAQYQTTTKTIMVSEGRMAWKPVLCETNVTPEIITSLQSALQSAGHNPGDIDGIIGGQTMAAVRSYQSAKGLARGGLTMETLKSLGL